MTGNLIQGLNSSLPSTIGERVLEVICEAVITKASGYIRRYETATDAMILRRGLLAIRTMVIDAKELSSKTDAYSFSLIKKELRLRIKEVVAIITKFRKSKPEKQLTLQNLMIVLEVEKDLEAIFGADSGISLIQIMPFLLEAREK